MISVGSNNDGRKWKGLGFGGGVEEMEDTELEEGEAYNTYHRDDDDEAMDPDVSLSYIDEKLRDVLGHFQKDFEGEVSAGNLGSKFGGYGSFLPADLRSPVWSRPRTPPNVCDDNRTKSLNDSQQEGEYINSVNPPKASITARQGLPSTAAASTNDPPKRDVVVPSSRCIEESTSSKTKRENNYSQPSDQKTLKVRIKVGSDDLSTQRNADIYSGLGLDISPSTSLDESPPNSEGFSHEHLDASELSPTSILQMMVSFPIQGNHLLSPLPDYLINLIEKEKLEGDSKPGRGQKNNLQNPNRTDAAGDAQVSGGRKPKLPKKIVTPTHANNHNVEDNAQNDTCVSMEKDGDINPLVSEGHVANDANAGKRDSRRNNTSRIGIDIREKTFSKEFGLVEKPRAAKASSAGKIWEDQKMDLHRDPAIYPRDDAKFKEENPDALAKSESNVSTGRKSRLPDSKDPLKQKTSKKAVSHEEDKKLVSSRKERSSSKGQKKMKKGDSYGAQNSEIQKDIPRVDFKSQKEHVKARDAYRDLFGDIELEQGDDDLDSPEIMLTERAKESGVIEKNTDASDGTFKERLNGKKTSKPSISEAYPKASADTGAVTGNGNGHPSDVPPGTALPLVEEDWVGCDRCQQWRLLPTGTNVADLPDKWVCSMLNWLPGMNSCDISEEETTKAVVSLYHLPVPNPRAHHGGVLPGLPVASLSRADVGNSLLPDPVPSSQKKNGTKELSEKKQDGANSTKKVKASVRTSSSSGANPSLSENDNEPRHVSKSIVTEKQRHKQQKQKNKLLGQSFDGGEPRSTSSKSRRDATDLDYSRISKKAKVDEMHLTDEDWRGKVGPSSSSGLSGNASGMDRQKYKGNHIKDTKSDKNSNPQGAPRNRRDNNLLFSSDDDPLHKESSLGKDDVSRPRKRKMSETQNFVKETSENDHRKEKKARVSKSQGKESSISKSSGGTSKQSRRTRDQQMGLKRSTPSRRSVDTMDSLKRETAHLSQAAASSSSKVSDTHRKNSSLREMKGSPVESVSSSPMRFSHADKSTSMRGVQNSKDNSTNACLLTSTPRRRSDCEDDIFATQRGSLESSVIDAKESDIDHLAGSEPDFANNHHFANGGIDDVSRPRKSAKGSSTRSKESNESFVPEIEKGKVSDKAQDKFGFSVNKGENDLVGEKEAVVGKGSGENSRRVSQSRVGGNENADGKAEEAKDIKQNIQDERSSKRNLSEKAERTEMSGRGKMHPLPPSGRGQNETVRHSNHVASGSQKVNGVKSSSVGTSKGDDTLMAPKMVKKTENQNGNQPIVSKHSTTNGHRARDVDAPSPARRDPSAQAASNAVKEAKDLKHLADRLKNSGSNAESTSLYFQAVLKFLHGASLLESSNNEASKQSEMIQSMQMYSSTAKLCEFCAHEYERSKDMAAAALAYKCMEVAYMRVVYSSHSSAGRDRHELQTALQIVPPGESPSSSASDVDNLNNLTTLDKVTVAKSVGSPQVAGSHVIAARNRPNFVRLLNFAQDVNSAMEASRKSRIAFAAANPKVEEGQRKEAMTSVKKALDFNFQDVDGLLRLIRQAMEAISR